MLPRNICLSSRPEAPLFEGERNLGKTLRTVFPKLQAEWISLLRRTDAKEIGARSKNPGSPPATDFHLPQRLLSSATRPSGAFMAEEVLVS